MKASDKVKTANFQLSQIVGSSALEGVVLSNETKQRLAEVLEGTLSAEDAKKAVIDKYAKANKS